MAATNKSNYYLKQLGHPGINSLEPVSAIYLHYSLNSLVHGGSRGLKTTCKEFNEDSKSSLLSVSSSLADFSEIRSLRRENTFF